MLGPPRFAKHHVNESGARVDEILNGIFRQKASFQLFMGLPQVITLGGGRAVRFSQECRQAVEQKPRRATGR